jgi:DNA-binding MarR family transcriptional regulator
VADSDAQLAETWARLMGMFSSRRDKLFAQLAALQLTPPHGVAMMSLLHGGPTRMGDIAESMACDASYITAVADRLEELGLAERRGAPDDRRAKELALTPQGEEVARSLHAIFNEPPETMRALSPADQAALARIARKLGDVSEAGWMPSRTLR